MKNPVLPLLILAAVMAGCSSTQSVTHNYDDGIYYDPATSNEGFALDDIKEPETVTTNPDATDGVDYYDPTDNSAANYNNATTSGATTIVNNYYSSPTFRSPGVNTGFYWNSWGGWGIGMGYGYYNPWYYDPFFYDPYWGWGYGYGYGYGYNPWHRGYCSWYPGYGAYNSYWAGYYTGYYYGSVNSVFDAYNGRNVTYVRNVNTANRSNSFNSINRNRVADRKSTTTRDGRVLSRDAAGRTAARTTANTATSRELAAATRFSDRNMARTTLRERATVADRTFTASSGRAGTTDRTTANETVRSRGYNSDSYDYVKERTSTREAAERTPVTSDRVDRQRNATQRDNTIRSRTQGYSREDYTRSRNPNSGSTQQGRDAGRSNQRQQDIYVPSENRSRNYDNSNNNRSRTTTPSRSNNERNYTPSNRSNDRSYTPSTPSRDYTPSRSNNRSSGSSYSTPSRSSGSSYSAPSSTPSRSSGSSGRSSGNSRRR